MKLHRNRAGIQSKVLATLMAFGLLATPAMLAADDKDKDKDARASAVHQQDKEGQRAGAKLEGKSIVEALRAEDENYSIFISAIERSGVLAELQRGGPYTVLAPTDDAFRRVANFEQIQQNPQQLRQLVRNHIIETKLKANHLEKVAQGETVEVEGQRAGARDAQDDQTMLRDRRDREDRADDIADRREDARLVEANIRVSEQEIDRTTAGTGDPGLAAQRQQDQRAGAQAGQRPGQLDRQDQQRAGAQPGQQPGQLGQQRQPGQMEHDQRATARTGEHTEHDVQQRRVTLDRDSEGKQDRRVSAREASRTLAGGQLQLTYRDDKLRINNAEIEKKDIEFNNGIIHGINTVLMPDQRAGAPGQMGTTPGQQGTTPGQRTAPGQTGQTPGQQGTTPGQMGTTPGQQGTAPGQQRQQPSQPGQPEQQQY